MVTTSAAAWAATADQLAGRDAVRRLLQRVGLGPRPGELDAAAAAGFDATLAALTTPGGGTDPGVAATPPPALTAAAPRPAAAEAAARRAAAAEQAAQAQALQTWWLDRMVAVQKPLPERLTWFWHGHFATSVRKVRSAALMYIQNDTQRRLGAGDFGQLAQAMAIDPAMLIWLDGGGNRVGKPNENLAREFMELFTLGVGNYTETDVRQAARALTGWRVDYTTDTAAFTARAHDPGPETVLGAASAYDAHSLVDLLVTQPPSPRFVAGRIWARFVSNVLPEPATLDRLAAAYGPNRDITAVLRAAVTTPAFRDPSSVLVRQPVEWLVAALRALKLPASKLPTATLHGGLAALGQTPFAPPSVGGWPAGTSWLTTSAALARFKLAQAIASAGDLSPITGVPAADRIRATAALLGLPTFTDRTTAALTPLAGQPQQLLAAALASPENTINA